MLGKKSARMAGAVALMLGLSAVVFAQDTEQQPQSAPAANAAPDGGGGPGGGAPGGGRGGHFTFEQLDKNGDGKITTDEFQGPKSFFDRADTNKDGAVTKDEFDNFRQQFAGSSSRPSMRGGGGFSGFQDMMLQRLKDQLGASDDEWKVLQPKLQKVMDLQMKTRISPMIGGFMGGRGGSRGGPGGPGGGPGGNNGPGGSSNRGGVPGGMSAFSMPEADALRAAVDDKTTPADKLAAALQAYRDARKKAQDELTAAQGDLVKLLTPRQEAMLVMSGMLE